jgi:hypothetical protein
MHIGQSMRLINLNPAGSLSRTALILTFVACAPAALAVPIAIDGTVTIERNGAVADTDVTDATVGSTVGDLAFEGGTIRLTDQWGNGTSVLDPGWWAADGVTYTTNTNTIWVEFIDLFITGFSFNIGADQSARAYINAFYEDGEGNERSLSTNWFNGIGPGNSPSFGVFVDSPADSCARITKIEIDPYLTWGIGNFAGTKGDPCVAVPEPGTASLIGLGMLTLAFGQYVGTRRRQSGVSA